MAKELTPNVIIVWVGKGNKFFPSHFGARAVLGRIRQDTAGSFLHFQKIVLRLMFDKGGFSVLEFIRFVVYQITVESVSIASIVSPFLMILLSFANALFLAAMLSMTIAFSSAFPGKVVAIKVL